MDVPLSATSAHAVSIRPGLTLDWPGDCLYGHWDEVTTSKPPAKEPNSEIAAPSFHHRTRMQSGEHTKQLRLLQSLGPRRKGGSVWLCQTTDEMGQVAHVVLKLFRPTLLPDRSSLQEDAEPGTMVRAAKQFPPRLDYILSKKLACYREVMSYERLKHLQGVHIPCSYGFYEFKIPVGGRPVIGHVLEYIDGHEPQVLIRTLSAKGQATEHYIRSVLESIFSAYKAIHKAGVAHRDIACRNMRIVWDAHRSTMPRIVILDFDRAVTAQDCWTVFTEQQSMREFLLELAASDSSGCVSDWVVGSGAVLYDRFPLDLLPPHKREAAPAVQSDELGLPNGR